MSTNYRRYKSPLQQVLHVTTEDLRDMDRQSMRDILDKASRLAEGRRSTAMKKLEREGIRTGVYAKQDSSTGYGGGNMSYRYANFQVDQDATLQQMKAKFAEIKRFLSDRTTTYAGAKQLYEFNQNVLTANLGKVHVYDMIQDLERKADAEGWSPAKLRKMKYKLVADMANQVRSSNDEALQREVRFLEHDTQDLFWELYNKLREEYNPKIYGSDELKEILYDEVTRVDSPNGEAIYDRVKHRLKEVYNVSTATGHDSFVSGRGYSTGGNKRR